VLKSIESVLRERTGFRYSVVPNLSIVLDDFTNRDKLFKAASEAEFAQLIPAVVNEWCDKKGIYPPRREKKRKKKADTDEYALSPEYGPAPTSAPKVEIDLDSLAQIRKEAEATARKLIIEEYEDALPAEQIEITSQVIDEVFDAQAEEASVEMHSQFDFSALPDDWKQFAESLDTQALELLKALSNGTAEALCRDRGVLPETAFEELNAAALEHIGDTLIENGELIPDYAEDVAKIIAHMNN